LQLIAFLNLNYYSQHYICETVETIKIQNTREDLYRQYKFIKKLDYKIHYQKLHRTILQSLLISTAVVVGLIFLTDTSSLITIKAITFIIILLAWALRGVYIAWFFIKMKKVDNWIHSAIANALESDIKHSFWYDDQKIVFITEKIKSEIAWSYYKYYAEDTSSVYFFPENTSLYSGTSFSESEIGNKAIEDLKKMARMHLVELKSQTAERPFRKWRKMA
jgi:hypothetical protein